ncbi:5'-methylthioadenosine/S-adenosylhomocysteine nucleosidase [Acuticoccus sp. I52.16.1]|uniref:5'-methylthioadenosine/S-adenosylhomocysteine nucleosidase n=1 Tax=Acuticoccus sp. I52.16.1 TaxID=2928472 RepID=UPI001FD1361B|nr:5'-methylthioadenosine/S-adenosylhomocysteine nucleosidase [Acuticoccus sp. I52.16.1]UOM35158.1 5'-methylthioadenosine/S-adenosylhomocysteine nucleosidase [Acuticoccus sp. I52.16.1]
MLRPILPMIAALALSAAPAVAEGADGTPRIAVMSAFAPEWGVLQDMLENRADTVEHGVRFVTGEIEGAPVVLLLSGVGMVNAAMSAQMVVDRYDVAAIAFSGIAGGVDPSLTLGEVVVPAEWGSYFNVLLARQTGEGYEVPPFMHRDIANLGMIFPQPELVRSEGVEEPEHRFWFPVDRALLETARAAVEDLTLDDCMTENLCLTEAPGITIGGKGVSGSAFVDNADVRAYIFDTFEAKVVDMESAAVAHVAATNGVPFIAFRSLSDLAGGSGAANEMEVFMGLAAANSAAVLRAFLAEWAADRP